MNLHQTLDAIAVQLNLDPRLLKSYADEDISLAGYHPNDQPNKWPMGSIFEVEGQILYALTRALQPELVVELGTFYGCSTSHFLLALSKNGHGELITVDNGKSGGWFTLNPGDMQDRFTAINADALEWVHRDMPQGRVGLLFEDMIHRVDTTETIWRGALENCLSGAVIISHDAAHFNVGREVKAGIARAGGSAQVYLTEPSQCGLAIGQKP